MELVQRPQLKQKITLSPQVYQGLNILAMPIAALEQFIETEILENPVLEVEDPEIDQAEDRIEERNESQEEDRAWDEWLDMYEEIDAVDISTPRDPNSKAPNTEDFVGGTLTFDEHLVEQVGLLDISDAVSHAAKAIVGLLDGDGFFAGTLDEVASIAGVSGEVALEALEVIQGLDPPGVGARDLTEALTTQMEYLGLDEPLLKVIIREHLGDIAANHYRKIARAEHVSEREVARAVGILKTLNPRPAALFSPAMTPHYIVPDVTVRRFDDTWLIISNDEVIPTLRVSPKYRSMLRSGSQADDETRTYLKEKIRSAESVIKNIDRRKDTVTRITEIILAVQTDFFEDGKGMLRPLRLEDVAIELGVHLSTVSRGVTGKYMATPYGLYELKHFFAGGYRSKTGMDVASTSIKQRIREIVRAEDSQKPYSDQRLAGLLAGEGVTVARRTIAKYREELNIEPSWARKR